MKRGTGCLVHILSGRRHAGLVRLGGRACPSRCCHAGMVTQLVGPTPTQHGTLGGRQASAGYGPATGASASAQTSQGRTRVGGLLAIRPTDTRQDISVCFFVLPGYAHDTADTSQVECVEPSLLPGIGCPCLAAIQ